MHSSTRSISNSRLPVNQARFRVTHLHTKAPFEDAILRLRLTCMCNVFSCGKMKTPKMSCIMLGALSLRYARAGKLMAWHGAGVWYTGWKNIQTKICKKGKLVKGSIQALLKSFMYKNQTRVYWACLVKVPKPYCMLTTPLIMNTTRYSIYIYKYPLHWQYLLLLVYAMYMVYALPRLSSRLNRVLCTNAANKP